NVSVGAVSTYTFTGVSANHTIAATFALNTYTITVSAGANGSISPSGSVTVNYDGSQSFTITANAGYHVADVLVDNVSVGAVASYSFANVTSNHSIAATFAINTYTITASAGAGGSISPSGSVTVNYDGSQSFTITANAGYHVADVLVDNVSVGAVVSYSFANVTSNHSIAATFAINTYTITASAGAGGSINPSGSIAASYGSTLTFTIAPSTGYQIADVLIDNMSVGAVSTYVFGPIDANHTIAATFSALPGSISGAVRVGASGLPGVLVTLLDQGGHSLPSFPSVTTDALGTYSFLNVPSNQQYQVVIVEPLGYSVDENPKPVTVQPATQSVVDFALTKAVGINTAAGLGYWMHQFKTYASGKGKAQETQAQLTSYMAAVQQYYTPHFPTFSSLSTFDDWLDVLSGPNKGDKREKAKQHLAALVMNFASLKVGQYFVVTADGKTAGDVLTFASVIVNNPSATNSQLDLAKTVAEKVNNEEIIAAGIVGSGGVLYKGAGQEAITWGFDIPEKFSLSQNYPNPFNPTTTINYGIAADGQVTLRIYNALGQEVVTLVDGFLRAGRYHTQWNASGLASGIYYFRIQTPTFHSVQKMVLLK
ncbi:MAG: T9SS type A sorting domain-containing protein, partial [Bacteroidota bacterium]